MFELVCSTDCLFFMTLSALKRGGTSTHLPVNSALRAKTLHVHQAETTTQSILSPADSQPLDAATSCNMRVHQQ